MSAVQLDEIDVRILATLQEHARISNVDLAHHVGLSAAPCLRRVRTLEQQGVIRRYAALLDSTAVHCEVDVFVQISLDLQTEGRLEAFEQAVTRCPEVLECYLMTGEADYLLRVAVPDVAAYERFLKTSLMRLDGIAGIKASFALRQVKYSTALPLLRRSDLDPPLTRTAAAVRPASRPLSGIGQVKSSFRARNR